MSEPRELRYWRLDSNADGPCVVISFPRGITRAQAELLHKYVDVLLVEVDIRDDREPMPLSWAKKAEPKP